MSSRVTSNFVRKGHGSSDAVNFISLVSGMVTSLILMLMAWNYLTGDVTIEQVISGVDANSGIHSLEGLTDKEFDASLQRATADQLSGLLDRISDGDDKQAVSVRFRNLQKVVKVANQMLQLPLNDAQRKQAAKSKLQSLSVMYGLDFINDLETPDIGAKLRESALENYESDNPEILKDARLSLIKVDIFESLKQGKQEVGPLCEAITAILKQYPDDEIVHSNVSLLAVLSMRQDNEFGIELIRGLLSSENQFSSKRTDRLLGSFKDQILLQESKIQTLFSNRWIDGQAGQEKLLQSTLELISNPSCGQSSINQVLQIANWFEQQDQYDRARQIYRLMVKFADLSANGSQVESSVQARSKTFGAKGLKRCDLVGQPFYFNGNLPSGNKLDVSKLADRIVIVIFASQKLPQSVAAVKKFYQAHRQLISSQVSVLICLPEAEISPELAASIDKFQVLSDIWKEGENSMMQQCPVDILPHALIVDHKGTVIDVNIPMDELVSAARYLATRRFDDQ